MKAKTHLQVPAFTIPLWWPSLPDNWRAWPPNRGSVLFTLLVVGGLLWAGSAGALPLGRSLAASGATSTSTVAYQGRLADTGGNPLTGTYSMIFRLYNALSGGTPLWEEQWTGSNGVKVSDGLFNIMLGSLTPIPQSVVTGHDSLWLGITVGTDDEMAPGVQLGSVPFAVQALTVPDGSITTAKLADAAVTGSAHASSSTAGSVTSTAWTEIYSVKYTPTKPNTTVIVFASLSLWTRARQQTVYAVPFIDESAGNWTGTDSDATTGFSWTWQVSNLTAAEHTFSIRVSVRDPGFTADWRCPSITILELKR